jgi:acyl-CoA thioester hydrolase
MTTTHHTGPVFTHKIRVPYGHTDQMGFVYYAHHFLYFEMARSEMLRSCELPYGELERKGIRLPVVESHCEYEKPARFDDELTVVSRCRFEGPRLRVEYELKRGDERLATGYTCHVCMTADGRVTRPVPELRRLVQPESAAGEHATETRKHGVE